MNSKQRKLPFTVLSGFFGSGKTRLLNHVVCNREGLLVAKIVNDMSEVNIDAQGVGRGDAVLSHTDQKLVEMTNGCICCTLREDILIEVANLAREGRLDYRVNGSTGVSEPAQGSAWTRSTLMTPPKELVSPQVSITHSPSFGRVKRDV